MMVYHPAKDEEDSLDASAVIVCTPLGKTYVWFEDEACQILLDITSYLAEVSLRIKSQSIHRVGPRI